MEPERAQQTMKPMVSALSHRQNSHQELRPSSLVSSKRPGLQRVAVLTAPWGSVALPKFRRNW